MAYDETGFPQDLGTGLQETVDWNDAGAFAWLAHHPNATGCVIDGFEISADWTSEIMNISEGVALLRQSSTRTNDHSADDGPSEKDLVEATFRVQRGPSGDITLNSGVNHVYLGLNQTENDEVFWQVNTSEDPPTEPYLEVARVNLDDQSVVYPNYFPTATFQRVLITPFEEYTEQ